MEDTEPVVRLCRRRGTGGGLLLAAAALLALFAAPPRAALPPPTIDADAWFEAFKAEATDAELYRFLYAMPKGGDLHHHTSGSILDDWAYDMALALAARGYRFLTRVRVDNCRPPGSAAVAGRPPLLLFHTLQESSWRALPACERGEYKRLEALTADERRAWLDSMMLDKAHEGRAEFFGKHWQRMGDLYANPYYSAEALVRNMQALGREGLLYLEPMVAVLGHRRPDGSRFSADEAAAIFRRRLAAPDARATGVTVRLQVAVLRFAPDAEETLRRLYGFVDRHRDLWVAVNLVGREDNDKGFPLRFLDTLRDLRRRHHGVRLAIHAGEVDEPNHHVRDTLLLGADRIGHGVNLITDPETLRLMRHGPYLVEINLISNLLLGYVDDYREHPFPEYLRTGIPVALSTDDRGMWDSNMTDEFFVAVREFNLSWSELKRLSRNSLRHAFVGDALRARLLERLDRRLAAFEHAIARDPARALATDARTHGFLCRRYALCGPGDGAPAAAGSGSGDGP